MTTTPTSGAAIQRYKIGYHADEWGQRSSTPSGIPDASGSWVRYADHVNALAAGQATAQAAPALWLSPEQFANFMDTDEAPFGKYIPARKTSAGKFTMPLFAALAQAQPVAEPAGAVSEMVKFTDQSTANPIEKARRYLAHVANKKPNNPYFFADGYPRASIADDAAAALSVLEQLAASHGQAPAETGEAAEHYRNAIARAHLLDSDLSNLTARGAKAWAGVDAQGLRDGGASPSANAGEPSAHIKEPYTLAEIKAKIDSNDYSAEMLLQHAMLLLDSVQD